MSPEATRRAQLAQKLDELLAVPDEAGVTPCNDPSIAADARDNLLIWLQLVDRWRRRTDLTAARDDAELVDLMVADAVHLAPHVPRGVRLVDVGSGAGPPGLPLGLLRPDLEVTLVEPLQKRAAFLRTTLGTLSADVARGFVVQQMRVQDLSDTFDVAISRATLPPEQWIELGTQLAPQGQVWLLLAKLPLPTREGWRVRHDEDYRWPLTGAARRAVCVASISA
jgi:16S rRNA (guanine527-N7)-methyltransferase